MELNTSNQPMNKGHFNLSLSYKILSSLLVITIVVMLLIWKPWSSVGASDRTVQVTGQATLTAVPDEYVFSPSYSFTNQDQKTALSDMSKKSDELVTKLKALGVPDKAIKTNSNSNGGIYCDYCLKPVINQGNNSYTLALTITVDDRDLAQKIQDYLLTTSPEGSISPQIQFSNAKQKDLENRARDEATKDARSKADQEAKNLGFKVAKVKTVSDGQGFNTPPIGGRCGGEVCAQQSLSAGSDKLTIQPGENELSYSVIVVYFIH